MRQHYSGRCVHHTDSERRTPPCQTLSSITGRLETHARRRRRRFRRQGHEFTERDFFKDRFSKDEIVELLNGEPTSALFNPKSQALKKAGIDPASLSEEQMLDLLVEEPRYWRRPVAVIDGRLIAGANAKTLAAELDL